MHDSTTTKNNYVVFLVYMIKFRFEIIMCLQRSSWVFYRVTLTQQTISSDHHRESLSFLTLARLYSSGERQKPAEIRYPLRPRMSVMSGSHLACEWHVTSWTRLPQPWHGQWISRPYTPLCNEPSSQPRNHKLKIKRNGTITELQRVGVVMLADLASALRNKYLK